MIALIVRDHGLSATRKRRRGSGSASGPLSECSHANAVWSADFKGWFRTGDGRRCEPLTITDGFSRYLLGCHGLERTTLERVQPLFEATFRRYGLPHAIRTDNGRPVAAPGVTGLSRLSVWWIKLGITPERIRRGHPEENGRHERFHLTSKQEATTPPSQDLRRQQRRLNRFQKYYNHERPHEALNQTPPGQHYHPCSRSYPRRLSPVEYDTTQQVCRVYPQGCFYWRGELLFLSETLGNEHIAIEPTKSERYYAVNFAWLTIAYVDVKSMKVLGKLPKNACKFDNKQGKGVNYVPG